jgi:DNA-binding GntR family transcriptional regulator
LLRLAVERATKEDIARMQELLATAGPLVRARDREKLMNLDRAFHRLILDAAHNSILADILTMLHERSLRFWFIAFDDDLQLRRVDEEHRAVLSAIKQGNRAEAEAAMRTHIESSCNHIMRAI